MKALQSQHPKVSIIILSLNRMIKTIKCLESIYEYTNIPYEIIVIDQGSNENELNVVNAFCEHIGAKLIKIGCNLGVSGGRSLGLNYVKSDYIYFLDNDIIVTNNWLKPLIETLEKEEHKRVMACCSQLRKDGRIQTQGRIIKNSKISYKNDNMELDHHRANEQTFKDILPGGCTLYRKKAFSIAGLDSRFFVSYEDIDFFMQLRNHGYKLMNCPQSVVNHYPDTDKNDYYEIRRNKKHFDNSKALFIKKWGDIL